MSKGDLVYVLFALIEEQTPYLHKIGEIVEIANKNYNPVMAVKFTDGKVITFYTNQVNKLFDV